MDRRGDGENSSEGKKNLDEWSSMEDTNHGYSMLINSNNVNSNLLPEIYQNVPDSPMFDDATINNILPEFDRLAISTPYEFSSIFMASTNGSGSGLGNDSIDIKDSSANFSHGLVANANGDSGIMNDSSINWSVDPALLHYADLLRLRVESKFNVATQPQPYAAFGQRNDDNFNPFTGNHISNCGGRIVYQNGLYPSYGDWINDQKSGSNLKYMSNGFRRMPNFSSLENSRGWILFLRMKLLEGNPQDIHMVFSEVKNHVRDLMVDRSGNYLIQTCFEICSKKQMDQLLLLVFSDDCSLMSICLDMIGTRAMQSMLLHLTTLDQRRLVVSVLRGLTVDLSKSLNGQHVIQHCLRNFPNEEIKPIQRVLAENCLDFATDKHGCCVLQVCAEYTFGEHRERILAEVAANALVLSEHPYGNYVVSLLVSKVRVPHLTAQVLARLAGSFVSLSMNKHGSNVVETCLKETRGDQPLQIVIEIINHPNFLRVLQDPYGNYVAQSALSVAKGNIHTRMINLIRGHFPFLQSHPHGKRVLARISRNGRHL